MRGNRVVVVLGAAVLLGLAASFMAWRYIQRPVVVRAAEKPTNVTQVVAAAVDLPVGTLLTKEKVKLVSVGADNLPPGTFKDVELIVDRGVVVPLVPNEVIIESKLAPDSAGAGLPAVIPGGMRAVSVEVDEVVGVAGFVLPGTRVDVLVTVDDRRGNEEVGGSRTKVVLQNVQVLAAGETIEHDAENKPQKVTVITLLVSPEDSERLTLASTEGKIQLALRNALDQDSVETEGSDIPSLVRAGRAAPAPAKVAVQAPARRAGAVPVRATTSVEMYRGVEKEVEQF